ncbi:hypothetical protein QF035_003407 [Streptomyces umbrinus]|uniref:Uncharacterized protein n=1 Tax=Streptomyces umbrinus TaxID=67370 RepID=A0ABU0SQL3_9ACTN|nr:hypothetical protein [Streptomyces umbrinus]
MPLSESDVPYERYVREEGPHRMVQMRWGPAFFAPEPAPLSRTWLLAVVVPQLMAARPGW